MKQSWGRETMVASWYRRDANVAKPHVLLNAARTCVGSMS